MLLNISTLSILSYVIAKQSFYPANISKPVKRSDKDNLTDGGEAEEIVRLTEDIIDEIELKYKRAKKIVRMDIIRIIDTVIDDKDHLNQTKNLNKREDSALSKRSEDANERDYRNKGRGKDENKKKSDRDAEPSPNHANKVKELAAICSTNEILAIISKMEDIVEEMNLSKTKAYKDLLQEHVYRMRKASEKLKSKDYSSNHKGLQLLHDAIQDYRKELRQQKRKEEGR